MRGLALDKNNKNNLSTASKRKSRVQGTDADILIDVVEIPFYLVLFSQQNRKQGYQLRTKMEM